MSKIQSPEVTILVVSDARPLWNWAEVGGKRERTDRQRDEATGVDVSAVEVIVASPVVGVQRGTARIPDRLVEGVAPGTFLAVTGAHQVIEFSTRKDSYDVMVTLTGVERADVAGSFVHQGVKAGAK